MKKIVFLILCLFPFISVNAEEEFSCLTTTQENPFKIESVNFSCSNVTGSTLNFFQNETDLKEFFTYNIDSDGTATIVVSDKLKFDSALENGIVIISDEKKSFPIFIKNNAYVKPTKAQTTTKNINEISYTVILDNKGTKEEKKCNVNSDGETCYIVLPKLETEGFKGWGISNSCKEGNIGSTKVNKNITYYACYDTSNEQDNKELYLKTLKILDNNNKEINFGTYSIKKREYEFKVLYEVESLVIEATSDENIKIEYSGNENLVVGENEVVIKLTDENKNTNEYKLKVNRLKEGETITNVNYLSALVIGNYDIEFNKSVFNYKLLIENDISKLLINAVPLNEKHTVKIKNNNNLEDGSVVEINVLDEQENVTTYKINIIKENNNILLYIAIGTILLLIVILIILILLKKNQKKKISKNDNIKKNSNETNVEVLNI